jgi:hypothetical protein
MFADSTFWQGRLKAAGIHLAISLAIAAMAALLVFFVWYPYPYREISGGRELFLLVVAVDVVMGPLMTLAVFSKTKPRRSMHFDFLVIGLLQLTALVYGLWTVAMARPIALAFEFQRFNVISAVEVPNHMLDRAPPELKQLSWTGPRLVAIRDFKDNQEKMDAVMQELAGVSLGARPDLWQPYEKVKDKIIAAAKPVSELKLRFPERASEIDKALKSTPANASAGYIPLVGHNTFWTVLINTNTAEVLAFVPLDPY